MLTRAGDVAGRVLVALADVDHRADDRRPGSTSGIAGRSAARLRARRRCRRRARRRGCSWPTSRHWRTSSSRSWSASSDEHERPVEVDEPAEPAGEHRSQRVRQRTGDVTGRELGDRSGVDDERPGGDVPVDGRRRRAGRVGAARRSGVGRAGSARAAGRSRSGTMPNPASSCSTNASSSSIAEQRVGGALAAERGGAVGAAGRGAERTGAVRRVDGEVVGEVVEAAQRVEHLVRQRLGELRAAQVGAPDRADHQRTAGEQRHG